MRIRVLGSAAGGGFPQWNCNCANCAGVRAGGFAGAARTQSSIAVESGGAWALVNVSPDVRAQFQANPPFQPGRTLRDTAVTAIVLVDGQVDHTTGLYSLREAGRPWPLWCTDEVHEDLTRGNPVLGVLAHFCGIDRRRIDPGGTWFSVDGLAAVRWRAWPVASKPAPYSPRRESPADGDNIALTIEDQHSGASLFYAPGLGVVDERTFGAMSAADCVLVDGTFWSDDEMIALGASTKRAREIGHLPQSGPGGMIEWLDRLPRRTRRILIHVNNTNPILNERSAQSATLARHGIEVACDGLEIAL
jgi:pyrroloquinoline quinone biosynthesis protein B